MWWIMPRAVDLLAKNSGTMRVGETRMGDAKEAETTLYPCHPCMLLFYVLHLAYFNSKCREIYQDHECHGLCGRLTSISLTLLVVIYVAIVISSPQ